MKMPFSAPLLVVVALLATLVTFGPVANAQMDFDSDEAASGGGGDGGDGMSFDSDEAGGGEGGGDAGGGDAGGDGLGLGLGLGLDPAEGSAELDKRERRTESVEEIYAVQRVFVLRINRVELMPSVAFSLNDPFVNHMGASVGVNYWFTNVLAVGANFLWYQGLESESDLNFFVRRSTRLAVPITQWQMGAHLNFTYVPIYGKFNMFNSFIFQWDAYVLGGVGLMRTRPIPVIDPEIRSFDFAFRVAFNAGLGIRVFISRWLAITAEFRDYIYLERFENLDVALGTDRQDPNLWTAENSSIVNNVTAHLGVSIFFPFAFEYRKPK